jgi:8-oxo-dGTP pyrophosphatase MutT (NUDIX family)
MVRCFDPVSARPADGQGGVPGADAARIAIVDGVCHQVEGAQAAILRGDRILVQLRIWPPGWELPGGHCDPGESPADTALREAREETGYEVRLLGIVGVYRWAGLRRTADAVYLVEAVGGTPRRTLESVSQRFVRRSRYPRAVFPWIPQRIEDAFDVAAGGAPVLRVQPVAMPHVLFFGSSLAGAVVDEVRRLRRRLRRRRGG